MKCSNNIDYSVVRYLYEQIQDNPQLLAAQIVRAVTTHSYVGCRAGDLTCPAIVAYVLVQRKWQRVHKNNTAQQDDDLNCCDDGFFKKS